jgi:hypothetical protein
VLTSLWNFLLALRGYSRLANPIPKAFTTKDTKEIKTIYHTDT